MTPRRRAASVERAPSGGGPSLFWKADEDRDHFDAALLLDTHVWVWTLCGELRRVSASVAQAIERASADGRLFVCDISFWEVAVKAAKGQLTFAFDATVWLDRAARAPGIRYVSLDRSVLVQSTKLTGNPHGDPADRMLIAAAQIHSMSLVTVDTEIIEYARSEPGVPVCDAR